MYFVTVLYLMSDTVVLRSMYFVTVLYLMSDTLSF